MVETRIWALVNILVLPVTVHALYISFTSVYMVNWCIEIYIVVHREIRMRRFFAVYENKAKRLYETKGNNTCNILPCFINSWMEALETNTFILLILSRTTDYHKRKEFIYRESFTSVLFISLRKTIYVYVCSSSNQPLNSYKPIHLIKGVKQHINVHQLWTILFIEFVLLCIDMLASIRPSKRCVISPGGD